MINLLSKNTLQLTKKIRACFCFFAILVVEESSIVFCIKLLIVVHRTASVLYSRFTVRYTTQVSEMLKD